MNRQSFEVLTVLGKVVRSLRFRGKEVVSSLRLQIARKLTADRPSACSKGKKIYESPYRSKISSTDYPENLRLL